LATRYFDLDDMLNVFQMPLTHC